ncbi:interleukin-1 alpha [Tenrec ecaudatus]|uniref:interleukin-1 alpha n=1 Tax=Tenrec ecaudatus TaxID=94439 RepID=UPI003F5A3612
MAQVPDLFEDLKHCYSEIEEYTSNNDDLSENQKPLYDTGYSPLHDAYMDEFISLSSAAEISKTTRCSFKESVSMVTTKGKVVKKRCLSWNETIIDEDQEVIANRTAEEIIEPMTAMNAFHNYYSLRVLISHCILTNINSQSLTRDTSNSSLRSMALQNLDDAERFDIVGYKPVDDNLGLPVLLRISGTQLFVSGQPENEPVVLTKMPEMPKVVQENNNLLFFWKLVGNHSYFKSAAYPDLFLATKGEDLVHLARGLPSITEFKSPELHTVLSI